MNGINFYKTDLTKRPNSSKLKSTNLLSLSSTFSKFPLSGDFKIIRDKQFETFHKNKRKINSAVSHSSQNTFKQKEKIISKV
jgi:hypothetical protein